MQVSNGRRNDKISDSQVWLACLLLHIYGKLETEAIQKLNFSLVPSIRRFKNDRYIVEKWLIHNPLETLEANLALTNACMMVSM
jgi:hypothetical protein